MWYLKSLVSRSFVFLFYNFVKKNYLLLAEARALRLVKLADM